MNRKPGSDLPPNLPSSPLEAPVEVSLSSLVARRVVPSSLPGTCTSGEAKTAAFVVLVAFFCWPYHCACACTGLLFTPCTHQAESGVPPAPKEISSLSAACSFKIPKSQAGRV